MSLPLADAHCAELGKLFMSELTLGPRSGLHKRGDSLPKILNETAETASTLKTSTNYISSVKSIRMKAY